MTNDNDTVTRQWMIFWVRWLRLGLWLCLIALGMMQIVQASEVLSGSAPHDYDPITPLPLTLDVDPDKVRLGEQLFHDVRLSRTNTLACSTCHQLAQGGDDGRPRARLADGALHPFNTPTLFNVAFNFRYQWTGAVRTLTEMTERVLLSPRVMNMSWPELLARLSNDSAYAAAFDTIYEHRLNRESVLDALTTYLQSLWTPNARFDRFLRGQSDALTAEEQKGYQLFKSYGCVACHQGVNVGGNVFQKFGIFPAAQDRQSPAPARHQGRFIVTGIDRDRYVFRVPSLRNVALTAPYFHDGRAPTLGRAVDVMARRQLGRLLTVDEVRLIVRFLHTLTGEYRDQPLSPGEEKS